MQLPDSLTPWQEWLTWFSPELAASVGQMLQQLHPLIGQFYVQLQGADAQHEGLGNLRRRGSYEHLLGSEWLLAEELPEEFLRRAASHEHLFLAPQQRAREAKRKIIALFDAGPLQLGSPRLVHLALWILLSRRARQAKGVLEWGILQAEKPKLFPSVTAYDLAMLLRKRTYQLVDKTHTQAWQEALETQKDEIGECWLIGNSAAENLVSWCTHEAAIGHGMAPETLRVTIKTLSHNRAADLVLPHTAQAVSLLKGTFIQSDVDPLVSHSPHRFAVTLPPVFPVGGNNVLVTALERQGLIAFDIPASGSGRKKTRNPRLQEWARDVSAISLFGHGRKNGAVILRKDVLHIWQVGGFDPVPQSALEGFQITPGRGRYLQSVWLQGGKDKISEIYLLDEARRLYVWRNKTPHRVDSPALLNATFDTGVLAITQTDPYNMVYAKQDQGWLFLGQVGLGCQKPVLRELAPMAESTAVLFSATPVPFRPSWICAVQIGKSDTQQWRLYQAEGTTYKNVQTKEITLRLGWRAVALLQENGNPQLLIRKANTLALFDGSKMKKIYASSSPITYCTVCPVRSLIAFFTRAHELIVYSIAERAVLMHIQNGEGDHAGA